AASQAGLPIAAINRGKTRADELIGLKLETDCAVALNALIQGSEAEIADIA
ncbi:MAG: hypothetical protein GY802_01005, partial [Gammaproteobacteria bacterium]|nr:hypothetical protein [Gammaproteobacteria bacterium]